MTVAQRCGMAFRCSACKSLQPVGSLAHRFELVFRCADCGPLTPAQMRPQRAPLVPTSKWRVTLAERDRRCRECNRQIRGEHDLYFYVQGVIGCLCEPCGIEISTG